MKIMLPLGFKGDFFDNKNYIPGQNVDVDKSKVNQIMRQNSIAEDNIVVLKNILNYYRSQKREGTLISTIEDFLSKKDDVIQNEYEPIEFIKKSYIDFMFHTLSGGSAVVKNGRRN